MAALEKPLGDKGAKKEKAATVSNEAKLADAAAKDPELAKKLQEEEEKKRKRAERFGVAASEPAEKKAKTTA